jgi:hypothetical protein
MRFCFNASPLSLPLAFKMFTSSFYTLIKYFLVLILSGACLLWHSFLVHISWTFDLSQYDSSRSSMKFFFDARRIWISNTLYLTVIYLSFFRFGSSSGVRGRRNSLKRVYSISSSVQWMNRLTTAWQCLNIALKSRPMWIQLEYRQCCLFSNIA